MCAAAVNLGQFVDDAAAAVVWAGGAATLLTDVFVLVAAVAVTWRYLCRFHSGTFAAACPSI